MSQGTRATWIGAFALAGLLLLVAFLLLLGRGGWFSTCLEYTMYFDKSVKGLSPGAPVMFRGVKIGSVSDIRLGCPAEGQADRRNPIWPIEVRVQIDPDVMMARQNEGLKDQLQRQFLGDGLWKRSAVESLIRDLVVKQGMRAQLQTLSLMTGKLCIELNFFPLRSRREILEIERGIDADVLPVSISIFERMFLSASSRDLDDYVNGFYVALDQMVAFVRSGGFRRLLEDGPALVSDSRAAVNAALVTVGLVSSQVAGVAGRVNSLVENLDKEAQALGGDLRARLGGIHSEVAAAGRRVGDAADSSRRLADAVHSQVDRNGSQVAELMRRSLGGVRLLEENLERSRQLLDRLREDAAEDSPLRHDLLRSLNEIEKAAMAMKNLADLLQRSPDALLRGNQGG